MPVYLYSVFPQLQEKEKRDRNVQRQTIMHVSIPPESPTIFTDSRDTLQHSLHLLQLLLEAVPPSQASQAPVERMTIEQPLIWGLGRGRTVGLAVAAGSSAAISGDGECRYGVMIEWFQSWYE